MIAYCIMTMGGQRHFITLNNPVDWNKEATKNFISVGGDFINTKSISEILVVKNAKHFQSLQEGYIDMETEKQIRKYLNEKEQERLAMLNLPLNPAQNELPNREILS